MPTIQQVMLTDSDGTPKAITWFSDLPTVLAHPFLHGIGMEYLNSHSALHISGHDPANVATEALVWNGAISQEYAYMDNEASATIMNVTSVSDNDSSVSVGARSILIKGLDGSYNEVEETIELSGNSIASTTTEFLRIHSANVSDFGARHIAGNKATAEVNYGDINIGTGVPVTGLPPILYGQIAAGLNRSEVALFTVPNGCTAYLTRFFGASPVATTVVEFFLRVREYGGYFEVRRHLVANQNSDQHEFDVPLRVPEKSDIIVRAATVGGSGNVIAGFDGWYQQ